MLICIRFCNNEEKRQRKFGKKIGDIIRLKLLLFVEVKIDVRDCGKGFNICKGMPQRR